MSHNSEDEDKGNIQNYLQENKTFFERFKKDQETINKNSVNFHQESYVKEEIMITDICDYSDTEASERDNILRNTNILFTHHEKSNNQLPSELKSSVKIEKLSNVTSDRSQTAGIELKTGSDAIQLVENKTQADLVNFSQESYVKEEIMITDICDYSDTAESTHDNILGNNKILSTNHENTNNQLLYELNSSDKIEKLSDDTIDSSETAVIKLTANSASTQFAEHQTSNMPTSANEEILRSMMSNKFSFRNFVTLYCPKCNLTVENIYSYSRKCIHCGTATFLQCLKCDRRYMNGCSMNNHLRSKCGPIMYYQCPNCDYKVISKAKLLIHMKRIHTTVAPEDYQQCERCGKRFKYELYRQRHEELCGKEANLQCTFCPYKGKDKTYMTRHIQNHVLLKKYGNSTVDGNRTIDENIDDDTNIIDDTSESGKTTDSWASIPMSGKEKSRVHQLMKAYCSLCNKRTIAMQGKNKCSKCSTKFSYYCAECNTKCPIQWELCQHILQTHLTGKLKQRHKCSECGKSFDLFKSFSNHRIYCGKEPNWQCDHCPYKTNRKSNLTTHAQKQHPKVFTKIETTVRKIYDCQRCGKKYKRPYVLKRHVQFYCGKTRMYACEHCGLKKRTKGELIIHLHTVHQQVFTGKVFKCKVCNKESPNEYAHDNHVKNCGPV